MPYSKRKSSLNTKFHSTVAQSTRFRAEEGEGEFNPAAETPEEYVIGAGGQKQRRKGRDTPRAEYNPLWQHYHQQAQSNPARTAQEAAYWREYAQRNIAPPSAGGPLPPQGILELEPEYRRPRVSRADRKLVQRGEREQNWRTRQGVYRVDTPKERKSVGSFISQEAAPGHKEWIEEQLQNPESEFNKGMDVSARARTGKYTPGQRRRLQIYTDALQRGEAHQEALRQVRSSAQREGVGRPAERTLRETRRRQGREAIAPPPPSGRATKFTSMTPTANEFRFGVDATSRPKLDDLKKRFPDSSERELIQIQQAGTEAITQELLANQKWAHETRRANLLGAARGRAREAPDKVTLFTTNVGHPAVSVPTDSLVGQYIIRKRKQAMQSAGVPASQLRGEFPDALRDQHVIDVATGTSWGIEGRQGLKTTTGFRFGNRRSPGYGRPRPLGGQILTDSAGRPLYDAQGNIRYSEGAMRTIDWKTPDVGVRVLIG